MADAGSITVKLKVDGREIAKARRDLESLLDPRGRVGSFGDVEPPRRKGA